MLAISTGDKMSPVHVLLRAAAEQVYSNIFSQENRLAGLLTRQTHQLWKPP